MITIEVKSPMNIAEQIRGMVEELKFCMDGEMNGAIITQCRQINKSISVIISELKKLGYEAF